MATLDASIRSLLKVISNIQNNGGVSIDFMKTSKPYWHICTEKFHAAYIKAKNPDGFRDMFLNFFNKHEDKFTDDVVDEDGDINDEWLKNKEVLSSKKNKKKSDDMGFSLRNINCRGEVIYFDESNDKIRNVCIPISEAYLQACSLYATKAKEGEYITLPAQLLHSLFTVMSFVVEDEDDKESIESNIKSLKEILEQLGENDDEDDGTGDTLTPLNGLFKNLAKKFNLGGDGKLDTSSIEKTVSNLLDSQSDMVNKAKKIFNTFSEKANIKEGADISSIITGVSEGLKDESLQKEIREALVDVASKVGFSVPDFNETEKSQINGSTEAEATEQE